jgi:hypothetical protein
MAIIRPMRNSRMLINVGDNNRCGYTDQDQILRHDQAEHGCHREQQEETKPGLIDQGSALMTEVWLYTPGCECDDEHTDTGGQKLQQGMTAVATVVPSATCGTVGH